MCNSNKVSHKSLWLEVRRIFRTSRTIFNKIELPTPVQKHIIKGKDIYFKRDDVLQISSDNEKVKSSPILYNGNKFRKLLYLLQPNYLQNVKTLISYGGNQSNAMAATAQFAFENKLEFHYYTKSVPSWLKENPIGNFKIAIDFNMKYIELRGNEDLFYAVNSIKKNLPKSSLFIERGGADRLAEIGVKQLASELDDFIISNHFEGKTAVFVPAGTGTTAFYAHKHLKHGKVVAIPCVPNKVFIKQQISEIIEEIDFPTLETMNFIESKTKFNFAAPKHQYMDIYSYFKSIGIEIDLIYGALAWNTIFEHWEELLSEYNNLMYVHTGGTSGNSSQIDRYQFKETNKT